VIQIYFSFLILYGFPFLDLQFIPFNAVFSKFSLLLQPSYLMTAIYGSL